MFLQRLISVRLADQLIQRPTDLSWSVNLQVGYPSARLASERVVQRRHEQLQLFEGAAVATDLRRLVLHHVAQVLQLLAANSALVVSLLSCDVDPDGRRRLQRV